MEDLTEGRELIAGKDDFDIVILDANLRNGDAFGLVEDLVRSADPRPRVIMITGSEIEARRAMESGADDYLTRPVSFLDVARVLKRDSSRARECAPRRRSNARVWTFDSEDCTDPAGDGFSAFLWNLMNISSTGAFILTETPLPVGMVLDLALDLNDQKVRLKARVVRVQDPTWGYRGGVGVSFLDLESGGQKALEAHVSQPESKSNGQGSEPAENERLSGALSNLDGRSTPVAPDLEKRLEFHGKIDKLNTEKRELADRLCKIERERADLANLYVASYQLNSALEPSEVLKSVIEILINLIGAEVFCIYVIDEQEDLLVPVASEGEQVSVFPKIPLRSGIVGESVESGRITSRDSNASAGSASESAEPLVCIPLQTEERRVGAIAIHRMFEQKAGFSKIDHEIFMLLSGNAARAILASRQLAQSGRKLTLIKGFLDLLAE